MYTIHQYQPPLTFIPPAFNGGVLRLTQALLPILLRPNHIRSIDVSHLDRLHSAYRAFQRGDTRLILAFRHPSVDDPLVLFRVVSHHLAQADRRHTPSLSKPFHSHFLYDRGIPLWAGDWVGWLYSQLGGVPIHRGKLDMQGLRTARQLIGSGQFPFAVAPEGATNGHNDILSPLEPGVAQLAFWAAEDLQTAGRSPEVMVLPIGLRYHYLQAPWTAIDRLLTTLETNVGLSPLTQPDRHLPSPPSLTTDPDRCRYQRLYRLGLHLLDHLEQFYRRFYHCDFPPLDPDPAASSLDLPIRLQRLLNQALGVAEVYFGLKGKGDIISRCRRLEQAGWDWIYRDDLDDRARLSALERGLADRVAEEAALRLWHMRIVESFVAVTGSYVREQPSADRFAETSVLIWDLITRLTGEGNPLVRPQLGPKRVTVTIGEPLSIAPYWSQYQENRRGAKAAITHLTQDLQTALTHLLPRSDE
ncbi:MAG: lysophospholipid acyltransferase family protein [Prochlorothrix sp.]